MQCGQSFITICHFFAISLICMGSPKCLAIDYPKTDCTEKQLSSSELLKIVSSTKVSSQEDLLRNIPPGTMQNYTLVYASQSRQKEGVSKDWPRVIRWSSDGKTVMAYTCNKKSPSYGKVELQIFDDDQNKFTYKEVTWTKSSRPVHHIDSSQKNCKKCHGDSDYLRPNWDNYPDWPGVYGSRDNYLDDTIRLPYSESKDTVLEAKAFRHFKKIQKNNPCYSTLPHSHNWRYPYGNYEIDKPFVEGKPRYEGGYKFEPNFRFNDVQGRLLGQQMATRFSNFDEFEKMKFLLLKESVRCAYSKGEENFILDRFPGLVGKLNTPSESDESPQTSTPLLYAYGNKNGVKMQDWTMKFSPTTDQYSTGNIGISTLTGDAIFNNLTKTDSIIKGISNKFRPTPYYDSPEMACVTRVADRLKERMQNNVGFCDLLSKKFENANKDKNVCGPSDELQPLKGIRRALTPSEPLNPGYEYIQNKCITCHGGDFGPNGILPESQLARLPELTKLLQKRLSSNDLDYRMPLGGPPLSKQEKELIINFLTSKTKQAN
jgi:hypothetical protein